MKTKCKDIVCHRLDESEADGRESQSGSPGKRRIQVTIERETVTMLVRRQPVEVGEPQALRKTELESKVPELPLASESDPK
jgi:hypothetical protein